MRIIGLPTFGILAALFSSACPGDVEDSGGGGRETPTTYRESACGGCVSASCSVSIEGCAADPECAAFLSCLDDCPIATGGDADEACEAACPQPAAATGQNALTALASCRTLGAGAECPACGHPPEGHPLLEQACAPPTASDACDRCEEERCCETRCDAACQGYVSCMQTCGAEATCEDGCAASHPEGVAAFGLWLGCQVPLCRDHCKTIVPGPCLECGLVHCSPQFADCFSTPSCYLRFLCGTRCSTAECYQACDTQFAEANALFGALLLCIGDNCIGGPCSGDEEL